MDSLARSVTHLPTGSHRIFGILAQLLSVSCETLRSRPRIEAEPFTPPPGWQTAHHRPGASPTTSRPWWCGFDLGGAEPVTRHHLEPPSARRNRPGARPRYGEVWGSQRMSRLSPSRLRRLLSLRSRLGSRRARITSRGDPGPRKPRGVEVAQVPAGLSGRGLSRACRWRPPCLPPHPLAAQPSQVLP